MLMFTQTEILFLWKQLKPFSHTVYSMLQTVFNGVVSLPKVKTNLVLFNPQTMQHFDFEFVTFKNQNCNTKHFTRTQVAPN